MKFKEFEENQEMRIKTVLRMMKLFTNNLAQLITLEILLIEFLHS